MKELKKTAVFVTILCLATVASAQQKVVISDFGLKPNSKENSIPFIKKALEECRKHSYTILSFPVGRYDFYSDDTGINVDIVDKNAPVTIGFDLKNLNNLTIDGEGSEFIFHGKMKIMNIDSCSNIILRNFSVDWDRPLLSQGEIVGIADNYVDLKIDKIQYPYKIENKKIVFTGENWFISGSSTFLSYYNKYTGELSYKDNAMGKVTSKDVEELADGTLRFSVKPKIKPELGTIVLIALHKRAYLPFGITAFNSKDIKLSNLRIYHALCIGNYFTRCENVSMDNASVTANLTKGRVFSSVADASGFGNCKGLIKVENCRHSGQGDDFMNLSGAYLGITRRIDDETFEMSSSNSSAMRSFGTGDEVWFMDPLTFERGKTGIIQSFKILSEDEGRCLVTFTEKMPEDVKEGVWIDNKTWCANLEFRNNHIGCTFRARGIMVQTAGNAIIENNYFHTAGAAIMMEGDISVWYGGPANRNVIIRNNVFDNCLSLGDGNMGGWGSAVICIAPYVKPSREDEASYHRNIYIENNTFKLYSAPIVTAIRAEGVYFKNNKIEIPNDYKPSPWQKEEFSFDCSRKIEISGNKTSPKNTPLKILINNMKETEIKINKNQNFSIDLVNQFINK